MNLNILNQIKKIDKSSIYTSIEFLPSQIKQVLKESRSIKIPNGYQRVNQIVVNGMGASNLGAGVIKAVFSDQIKVPINITPGYEVPANVDKNTLYIISSYSGGTEEPLSVYKEVVKRGAKVLAITSSGGGKLEKLMIKDNIPGYIYNPEFNPSSVPRIGLGYNIFGLAVLLDKVGVLKIKTKEIENIILNLEKWNTKLKPEVLIKNNFAKKSSLEIFNKEPITVGAEFLLGNLRIIRNQFCESGKNFSSYLTIPELNHYAMEGLEYPVGNKYNLIFIFVDSDFYHPRIKKRIALTKQIVTKNKIKYIEVKLTGKTKLEQSFEFLQLGTWITYYLGILNGKDPAPNPWVDWFKDKLA